MTSSACGQCPTLQARIAELISQLNAAHARIAWLEQQLSIVLGAASSTLALIQAELERPTMSRLDLIRQTEGRLQTAVDLVTGRR